MKKMRRLLFGFTEYIPAARWCFFVAVAAFIALVSVYKYIDLADTAIFSSLEIMFMTLSDTINIVFIYLPLYLFISCGIMNSDNFGAAEIVRFKSRSEWLLGKMMTYLFNTAAFMLSLILVNFIVFNNVFSFSDVWSSDFVGFRIMMGQSPSSFSYPPMPTVFLSCLALFLFYLVCGSVNMVFSLMSGDEAIGLFASLFIGIGLGLINMLTVSTDLLSQVLRCLVLIAGLGLMYAVCTLLVRRRDFGGKKQ